MKTVFSTDEVHPRDRFDYWHSVACQTIAAHDSVPDCRKTFHAELSAGTLAEIGLVLFESATMKVSHTSRHAALCSPDEILVCRQIQGRMGLEKDGRSIVLSPGDLALLDPQQPYDASVLSDSRVLVLKVPRRQMEIRVGRVRDLTALPATAARGDRAFASSFLGMLPEHTEKLDAAAEALIAEQALDLIAMSMGRYMVDGVPQTSSARAHVLTKLRAAVEARLADPHLDASAVAAAAGVSVRYANSVLADQNTSIRRLVLERRLLKCRRALEDPAQAHRTVSEIAYGWGFSDMTHFGRTFKAAYGMLPSELRRVGKQSFR